MPSRGWPTPLALAALILVIVVVAHLPLRSGQYVQDDHLAIEDNAIAERGDVVEIFSTSYWEGAQGNDRSLYRPIVILSYALERRVTGEPLAAFSQLINVGLHYLATLALVALTRRSGASPFVVAATGLLFALHPVHVEAIGNIVGRAEILAALGCFAALWLQTHAGPWPGARVPGRAVRWLCATAAGVCLFLALGSKEVAFATPLLLVYVEFVLRTDRRIRSADWWIDRVTALGPVVLAGWLYLVLRVHALEMLFSFQQAHPHDNPLIYLDPLPRLTGALSLLPRYVGLLLYPMALSADYSGPVLDLESRWAATLALLGLALLAVLVVAALNPLRRRSGAEGQALRPGDRVGLAAMLFLAPYLVVGNLGFLVGTIFAERLLYLPSAGFCLMMSLLLGRLAGASASLPTALADSRRAAVVVLAILATAYGTRSWSRSLDWRDDETVFRAVLRTRPRSPRAHFIVGKLAADRGAVEEAHAEFDRTMELFPDHVSSRFEKGLLYGASGDYEASERMFTDVIRLSPTYAAAHLNLAVALRRLDRPARAERSLRKAVRWDPMLPRAWAELGNLLLADNRRREAAVCYRRAIALGRDDLAERLRLAESEG